MGGDTNSNKDARNNLIGPMGTTGKVGKKPAPRKPAPRKPARKRPVARKPAPRKPARKRR